MKIELKRKVNFLAISVVIVALCAGSFFLGSIYNKAKYSLASAVSAQNSLLNQPSLDTFWEAWSLLKENHMRDSEISTQEKIWGSIKGLAGSYNDPYTEYFTPTEAKEFDESLSGSFGGVGIDVGMKEGILTVIAPLKDTPAYKAGIKKGDKIIAIDGTSTSDMALDEAINLIRGKIGTPVTLKILRADVKEPIEVNLIREEIQIPTLDTEYSKENKVFTIRLYQFSSNAPQLFRNALKEFADSGTNKLILDLRGNPGGYLDVAVDLASWFLPSTKKVVVEDYGKDREPYVFRSHGYDVFTGNLKMVVLVDEGSASASEILAGALKDNNIATLVGQKTFGKGVVQEVKKLSDGTKLKVTVARWLTPKGNSIDEHGLTPDYVVPITTKDVEAKRDPQYEKAVQLLNK